MRQFFTKKELKLKKKRLLMMVACMAVLLAGYVILTWPKKVESEAPTVIVESAEKGDVEIYGEYVGRIRAQQFVEVRARVEGYLENMLFAEGTYVTKNQVLFVINQDQSSAFQTSLKFRLNILDWVKEWKICRCSVKRNLLIHCSGRMHETEDYRYHHFRMF